MTSGEAYKLEPWEIDELYGQLHLLWDIVKHAPDDTVYRHGGKVCRRNVWRTGHLTPHDIAGNLG